MTTTLSLYDQSNLNQFGLYSLSRKEAISRQAKSAYTDFRDASVGIPLRHCGADGGSGAYFDHRAVQETTRIATTILKTEKMSTSCLKSHITQTPIQLRHTLNLKVLNEDDNFGLLYIPGISRKSYESPDPEGRRDFQSRLIKKGYLEGRPILAVCGGCWQLWEEFGGKTKKVKDHNYRGGMPRIKETTGKVGYNKQMHRIRVRRRVNLLRGAMKLKEGQHPKVNSVHWLAPSKVKIPRNFRVTAISSKDKELAPMVTHQGVTRRLRPEPCIEGYEQKYGAPIVGVQWHPEAYTANTPKKDDRDNHVSLLIYMVQAGKAFQIRKEMTRNLKCIFENSTASTPWKRHNLRTVKYYGKKILSRSFAGPAGRKEPRYSHLFERGKPKPVKRKHGLPIKSSSNKRVKGMERASKGAKYTQTKLSSLFNPGSN